MLGVGGGRRSAPQSGGVIFCSPLAALLEEGQQYGIHAGQAGPQHVLYQAYSHLKTDGQLHHRGQPQRLDNRCISTPLSVSHCITLSLSFTISIFLCSELVPLGSSFIHLQQTTICYRYRNIDGISIDFSINWLLKCMKIHFTPRWWWSVCLFHSTNTWRLKMLRYHLIF